MDLTLAQIFHVAQNNVGKTTIGLSKENKVRAV
jgi:hypothetical protein